MRWPLGVGIGALMCLGLGLPIFGEIVGLKWYLIILSILVPFIGLVMVIFNVGERIEEHWNEGNASTSPSTPSEGKGVAQEGVAIPVASTGVSVEFKGEDNRRVNWKG